MNQYLSPYVSVFARPKPSAIANIRGNSGNPLLKGVASFYSIPTGGILIQVEVFRLPDQQLPDCSGFFGMHIHENGDCTLPFDKTGLHYNPTNQEHPNHAGDLPPLLSKDGYAWTAFYDGRLALADVLGRSLVIHDMRDDFTTQPAGGSGEKIGCGVIEVVT